MSRGTAGAAHAIGSSSPTTAGRCVAASSAALQQRLQALDDDHQVDLRVVEHVGHLARAVVAVQRHAANAQRVHRQLVQQVLEPVLQQQRHAVAEAVAGAGVRACRANTAAAASA
jgi:hypothetical protein